MKPATDEKYLFSPGLLSKVQEASSQSDARGGAWVFEIVELVRSGAEIK